MTETTERIGPYRIVSKVGEALCQYWLTNGRRLRSGVLPPQFVAECGPGLFQDVSAVDEVTLRSAWVDCFGVSRIVPIAIFGPDASLQL
jgi:hypothetical protein